MPSSHNITSLTELVNYLRTDFNELYDLVHLIIQPQLDSVATTVGQNVVQLNALQTKLNLLSDSTEANSTSSVLTVDFIDTSTGWENPAYVSAKMNLWVEENYKMDHMPAGGFLALLPNYGNIVNDSGYTFPKDTMHGKCYSLFIYKISPAGENSTNWVVSFDYEYQWNHHVREIIDGVTYTDHYQKIQNGSFIKVRYDGCPQLNANLTISDEHFVYTDFDGEVSISQNLWSNIVARRDYSHFNPTTNTDSAYAGTVLVKHSGTIQSNSRGIDLKFLRIEDKSEYSRTLYPTYHEFSLLRTSIGDLREASEPAKFRVAIPNIVSPTTSIPNIYEYFPFRDYSHRSNDLIPFNILKMNLYLICFDSSNLLLGKIEVPYDVMIFMDLTDPLKCSCTVTENAYSKYGNITHPKITYAYSNSVPATVLFTLSDLDTSNGKKYQGFLSVEYLGHAEHVMPDGSSISFRPKPI